MLPDRAGRNARNQMCDQQSRKQGFFCRCRKQYSRLAHKQLLFTDTLTVFRTCIQLAKNAALGLTDPMAISFEGALRPHLLRTIERLDQQSGGSSSYSPAAG